MEASWAADDHSPEGCAGCRPVVFEPGTQKIDQRLTDLANKGWEKTTPPQRRAWHRVTCLNSCEVVDLVLAQGVMQLIQAEFKAAEH
jgi:hypothetical protein